MLAYDRYTVLKSDLTQRTACIAPTTALVHTPTHPHLLPKVLLNRLLLSGSDGAGSGHSYCSLTVAGFSSELERSRSFFSYVWISS